MARGWLEKEVSSKEIVRGMCKKGSRKMMRVVLGEPGVVVACTCNPATL